MSIALYIPRVADSPAGRFRLTITSSNNHSFIKWPDEERFEYILRDNNTGSVVWKRSRPFKEKRWYRPERVPLEGAPSDAYVSDSGVTVITTYSGELLLFRKDGSKGLIRIIDESNRGKLWTNYGEILDTSYPPYFIECGGTEYWVALSRKGGRILLDLRNEVIEECWPGENSGTHEQKKLLSQCKERDLHWFRDNLDGVVDAFSRLLKEDQGKPDENKSRYEAHKLVEIVFSAGVLRMKELVPVLRQLEVLDWPSFADEALWQPKMAGVCTQNDLTRLCWKEYFLRRVVHFALRRVGEKPIVHPCLELGGFEAEIVHNLASGTDKKERLWVPLEIGTRFVNEGRISHVREGMASLDVLYEIGVPDYYWEDKWYFEIDSEPPMTFSITWKGDIVKEINTHKPPLWETVDSELLNSLDYCVEGFFDLRRELWR